MTVEEDKHRDFYLALKRARGNIALRECNRTVVQQREATEQRIARESGSAEAAKLATSPSLR